MSLVVIAISCPKCISHQPPCTLYSSNLAATLHARSHCSQGPGVWMVCTGLDVQDLCIVLQCHECRWQQKEAVLEKCVKHTSLAVNFLHGFKLFICRSFGFHSLRGPLAHTCTLCPSVRPSLDRTGLSSSSFFRLFVHLVFFRLFMCTFVFACIFCSQALLSPSVLPSVDRIGPDEVVRWLLVGWLLGGCPVPVGA